MILAGDADKAAEIARGVLFYAARYRLKEADSLLASLGRTN
jgi:hypothetical protein